MFGVPCVRGMAFAAVCCWLSTCLLCGLHGFDRFGSRSCFPSATADATGCLSRWVLDPICYTSMDSGANVGAFPERHFSKPSSHISGKQCSLPVPVGDAFRLESYV